MSVGKHTEVGAHEAHDTYGHAGPEVLAHDTRVDLGAREEREQDRAEAGQEVDRVRDLQTKEVAVNGSKHNHKDSYENRNSNRNEGSQYCQSQPRSRLKPDASHFRHLWPGRDNLFTVSRRRLRSMTCTRRGHRPSSTRAIER